jgi:hypothetical protein
MQKNIWLAIHVGHGLHNVAQFDVTGDFADAKLRVLTHLEPHDLGIFEGKVVEYLVAPELMLNEKQAALAVLRKFESAQQEGKGLSVATFSEQVVTLLVNAVYDLDCHAQTMVVLHAKGEPGKSGDVTKHGLDDEGCLIDWPYGVLSPSIELGELAGIGFDEVHDVYRERQEASRAKLRDQGVKDGEVVKHICNHPQS